jgi:hypothetical protein
MITDWFLSYLKVLFQLNMLCRQDVKITINGEYEFI